MCDLCEETDDGSMQSCQDCGCLICWDTPPGSGDDVVRRAYVTGSGDLYCEHCGTQHDDAESDEEFDDYDPFNGPADEHDDDCDCESCDERRGLGWDEC